MIKNLHNLNRCYLTFCLLMVTIIMFGCNGKGTQEIKGRELLNVSYDPTREFYQEINPLFAQHWGKDKNESVIIKMSHGGAAKQARSVIDGLEADVVTLALEFDIDAIAKKGLMDKAWRQRLSHDSAPYTSTIVFLVRKGNPKAIKDWDDIVRDDLEVITPNPKTSGGARWNYLAAWAFAKQKWGTDEKAREFLRALYKNVVILDSGARGSTNTFAERGIGDVLLAWENEALLAAHELGTGKFEIIYPSLSILAEPPVALVDSNCKKHGTRDLAQAYLLFLYSEEAQELAAKHNFRPRSIAVNAKYQEKFPELKLVTVDEIAGGWANAQKRHFSDGGEFDQLYESAE